MRSWTKLPQFLRVFLPTLIDNCEKQKEKRRSGELLTDEIKGLKSN